MARTPTRYALSLSAALLLLAAARVSAAVPSVDGGLLFAGLDGAFAIQKPALEESAIQSELVGIFVDGRELDAQLVYRLGEAYYLPSSLLAEMGVRGSTRGGSFYFETPGGEVETQLHFFRDIYGQTYFHVDMLDEVLKVRWEFSQERYAFSLTLPWWQKGAGERGDLFADEYANVDVHPSAFGLSQIRLDHTQFFDEERSYGYSDLLLRGRLADGIWQGEVKTQDGRDARAEKYYWLRDFNHVQALVGHQEVLINPLLPTVETTGAQGLYSSDRIEFDPSKDQTRSHFVRSFGIPVKEIEGISQPGAIAELRINERPIARVRVNLDGTYRFDQVRNNSLQFQTVKVHILDQRSFVELDVQDFTRTPIDLLLDKGQTVGFAGVGGNGNPLDSLRKPEGEAAFGLVRYGLTESLTLEAGLQSATGRVHQVVGASASFGRSWAATASIGQHEGAQGYSADVYGRGERWQFSGRLQNFGEAFRSEFSSSSSFNELRYEYWVTPRISVGMHGRSIDSDSRDEDYLLPGFTWRFNRLNILKVWPDFDGSYRVDLRTSHRERDWFEFTHDSSGERAEYRFFKNPQLEFFGRVARFSGENAQTTGELGTIWYPNEYDDRSLLASSILAGDAGFGYRLTWQTTVLPGLFSHLELRDEPIATEFYDPGLQIRWTLSIDLAIAGGRPVPARNDFVQSRAGSIGGRLMLADGSSIRSQGIEQVAILINGRPHTAVLRGKHFFVRNVSPGIYDVALDSEHLPMNLTPQQITYRVRVAPASTSTVDFTLSREFGISGRVTTPTGRALADVNVEVLSGSGELILVTQTGDYGYFRVSGLPSGDYLLRIREPDGSLVEQAVSIEDDFIFDVSLTLAESAMTRPDA